MTQTARSFAIQVGATLGLSGLLGAAILMVADFATFGVVI